MDRAIRGYINQQIKMRTQILRRLEGNRVVAEGMKKGSRIGYGRSVFVVTLLTDRKVFVDEVFPRHSRYETTPGSYMWQDFFYDHDWRLI